MNRYLLLLAVFVLTVYFTACHKGAEGPKSGLTKKLANKRTEMLSDISYKIHLTIPDTTSDTITGRSEIGFTIRDTTSPLVLDFDSADKLLDTLHMNGEHVPHSIKNGHIIIPKTQFSTGRHTLFATYKAGNAPLNRNEEYLYTLFVPGRASQALPFFDQPDLKARFQLTLNIPEQWIAVSNSPVKNRVMNEQRNVYTFTETKPLPTYLFSFVAGDFKTETAKRNGRIMKMFHRETDSAKVARNREKIFDLHAQSLQWLEDYTDISYPFKKFDFVLIPSFQYGGMEHPGAILYRASRVFLDESPTQQEKLGQASLIAHETAHMWFGDLVTMEWFNDVWTKELYANFMASKIVNPDFPSINHEQRFILEHFPPSYSVDRTRGTHPIRQKLNNLKNASSLYGALIYHKAPIVMQKLERMMGTDALKAGIREYLSKYKFGNAGWDDLISILDRHSEQNITAWSNIWVEQAGRPIMNIEPDFQNSRTFTQLTITQSDPLNQNRTWPQELSLKLSGKQQSTVQSLTFSTPDTTISPSDPIANLQYIAPNADGLGYGLFRIDSLSQNYFLEHLSSLDSPKLRSILWIDLWENLLEGKVSVERFAELILEALSEESSEQNIQHILGYLEEAYWRFLPDSTRSRLAPEIEQKIWNQMKKTDSTSLKQAYFTTYRDIAFTKGAITKLKKVWDKRITPEEMSFSTRDYTRMALTLAIHQADSANRILDQQLARINNPDRRKRFKFIRPAVSNRSERREDFFQKLQNPENRAHEPWVIDAVGYLHHPLRSDSARKFIYPSLKLLSEIEATGDIFFPKSWLDATFSGHNSMEAALAIKSFIEVRENLSPFLRDKLLQAADPVFRAVHILENKKITIHE